MRVLIVHSRYSSAQVSGENVAVQRHVEALRRAGESVVLVQQETDIRARSSLYRIETAVTVATGLGRNPVAAVRDLRPDVIHVHNLFPNYGRRWVREIRVPIVATLHNYRPLCPAATFFRDGRVCTDCLIARSPVPSLVHACYRGSRLQTLPLAASTRFEKDPLLQRADKLVVMNETMRDLYVGAGVSADKVVVLPNFLPEPGRPGPGGTGWLFVGRLSQEKGLLQLVKDWPNGVPLVVVGDGPLRDDATRIAPSSVEFLGNQPPDVVRTLMGTAKGLVFPSRWFEGSPMVYLEALAAGTPVLAWEPSSVASLVSAEGTGMVAKADLRLTLERASETFPAMRDACRRVFDARYSEERHVAALGSIYDNLLRQGR